MDTPQEKPEASRREAVEATAGETTLAPTVVIMPNESLARRGLERTDLAEIERMVGEAIERSFRQHVALQAQAQVALLAASTNARPPRNHRVAAVGAGLLAGGAFADLVVLNWDIWVRGAVISSVGWLQQTGIIGTAAIMGAGAAALLIGAARGGRRAARTR